MYNLFYLFVDGKHSMNDMVIWHMVCLPVSDLHFKLWTSWTFEKPTQIGYIWNWNTQVPHNIPDINKRETAIIDELQKQDDIHIFTLNMNIPGFRSHFHSLVSLTYSPLFQSFQLSDIWASTKEKCKGKSIIVYNSSKQKCWRK